jgi:hypothetical protein
MFAPSLHTQSPLPHLATHPSHNAFIALCSYTRFLMFHSETAGAMEKEEAIMQEDGHG